MGIDPGDVVSVISLIGSAIAFSRTVRHRPEASWVNMNILTKVRNATPPLHDEHGKKPARLSMLTNDGDGPAYDVRIFGHNCVVRSYAWEKLDNGEWKVGERTMIPRIVTDDDDVKMAIWPPDNQDDFPDDAAICIHWIKSPTRLRHCGYTTIPVGELADKWWEEKDWQARHRIAERIREWWAHRKFHRNPEDAEKAPLLTT